MTPATLTTATPLTVQAAITARRSIRKYKPEPVPTADLHEICRLSGLAPSSANIQPWRFVVIQNPAFQARIQAVAYNQAQVAEAPALLVVYSDVEDVIATVDEVIHPGLPSDRRASTQQMILGMLGNKSPADRQAFADSQTHIALGFLVLAAQSLGYATSVMGGFEPDKVRELLDLPVHAKVAALVAVGVADEDGFGTHRHPVARTTRFIGPDAV